MQQQSGYLLRQMPSPFSTVRFQFCGVSIRSKTAKSPLYYWEFEKFGAFNSVGEQKTLVLPFTNGQTGSFPGSEFMDGITYCVDRRFALYVGFIPYTKSWWSAPTTVEWGRLPAMITKKERLNAQKSRPID